MQNLYLIIAILILAVIALLLLSLKKASLKRGSHIKCYEMGNQLVHDLKNHLISIEATSTGCEEFMLKLVDGYSKAKEAQLVIDPIQKRHLEQLAASLNNINNSANKANKIIEQFKNKLDKVTINN